MAAAPTFITRRYVNKDRAITKKFVQHAEKRGIKALFITVDAPQLGRREKVCIRLRTLRVQAQVVRS